MNAIKPLERAGVVDVFVVALSCAVVAGSAVALELAFRQRVLGRITGASYDFPWMAPAGYVMLVTPAVVAVFGLSLILRRPLTLATVVGALVAASLVLDPAAVWRHCVVGLGGLLRRRWSPGRPPGEARHHEVDPDVFSLRPVAGCRLRHRRHGESLRGGCG